MGGIGDLLGGLTGGEGGRGGGLDDLLGGLLGGSGSGGTRGGSAGMLAALAPLLGSLLAGGGLQKILSGFQNAGLGDKVDSWKSTGSNEPLSADEVEQVLSQEQIAEIAQRLGVSESEAAAAIGDVMPGLVDKLSPEGELVDQGSLDDVFGALARTGS